MMSFVQICETGSSSGTKANGVFRWKRRRANFVTENLLFGLRKISRSLIPSPSYTVNGGLGSASLLVCDSVPSPSFRLLLFFKNTESILLCIGTVNSLGPASLSVSAGLSFIAFFTFATFLQKNESILLCTRTVRSLGPASFLVCVGLSFIAFLRFATFLQKNRIYLALQNLILLVYHSIVLIKNETVAQVCRECSRPGLFNIFIVQTTSLLGPRRKVNSDFLPFFLRYCPDHTMS
jgi:hypothetical protein